MKISTDFIKKNTDKYFSSTSQVVEKHGDVEVVYGFFVRKPSIYALRFAMDFLQDVKESLGYNFTIYENFKEGDKVGAGDPLFFIRGSFKELSELETLILQKVGLACLCAWNAYNMSVALPKSTFISMLARHCVGDNMVDMCEYGAAVGSKVAKDEGAIGFIGGSVDSSAHFFGNTSGLGTMPHSLIGYAGSTLGAAQMYYETFRPAQMTVLVDYFGKEITDTLELCNNFKDMADNGNLSVRIDTHGARYLEGLDSDKSYAVIDKYVASAFHEYKDEEEIDYLAGMGVSGAAIFYLREKLDEAGFKNVKIIVSSGFNLKKCLLMSKINAPINAVGTGSYIPQHWSDTYTTADIVSYNGCLSVKVGREFLVKKWQNKLNNLKFPFAQALRVDAEGGRGSGKTLNKSN
ncbi:MAG: nicotinate phosphoribosyltransferase [Alphaproteobacteria bacterium]|jgi:nicotinate phosphoribosyltransferase|nr:nicotinate phosphoribosyltransferase [Alphaproteobacteria bacterium]